MVHLNTSYFYRCAHAYRSFYILLLDSGSKQGQQRKASCQLLYVYCSRYRRLCVWHIEYRMVQERYDFKISAVFYFNIRITVMFLSFRTDRSGQTVKTQIRLLRVYTVCNSLCIFWMHYAKETPSCSTFRVITANFRVSKILGLLRYFTLDPCIIMSLTEGEGDILFWCGSRRR